MFLMPMENLLHAQNKKCSDMLPFRNIPDFQKSKSATLNIL